MHAVELAGHDSKVLPDAVLGMNDKITRLQLLIAVQRFSFLKLGGVAAQLGLFLK